MVNKPYLRDFTAANVTLHVFILERVRMYTYNHFLYKLRIIVVSYLHKSIKQGEKFHRFVYIVCIGYIK